MINFNHPKLVKQFGTWVKVQVAFYDFLFIRGAQVTADEITQSFAENFASEGDIYSRCIDKIFDEWETSDSAWNAFLKEHDLV